MKNLKNLRKRSLALFLALIMCLGMMNLTALADDSIEEPGKNPVVDGEIVDLDDSLEEVDTPDGAVPDEVIIPSDTDVEDSGYEEKQTAEVEAEVSVPVMLDDEVQVDAVCICEYRCSPAVTERTWQGNVTYITRTETCPVCGGENGDWQSGCTGKQVVADGNPNHEHTWATGWGIQGHVQPNCTTPEAWVLLDISCGAEWLFAFDTATGLNPENHYYSDYGSHAYTITKEATCVEDGTKTYMPCLLCGKEVVEIIPAKGHTFGNDAQSEEANCTSDGFIKGTCTVCGEEVTEIIKGGHQRPENGVTHVDPTCTGTGSDTYTCTVCGEDIIEEIAATGHTFHETPFGDMGQMTDKGTCTKCGTTFYEVWTYEDNASPSGTIYETKFCGTVIKTSDGNLSALDPSGNPVESLTVLVNEALMGKTKTIDGVTTRVLGYRDIDELNPKIYEIGAEIPLSEIANMTFAPQGWNNYYSGDSAKAIYLAAVREKVTVEQSEYDELTIASVDPIVYDSLSTGVEIEVTNVTGLGEEDIDVYITVTIGSDAPVDTEVVINLAGTLGDKIGIQPGDRVNFHITVLNESGRNYQFVDNSAVLGTVRVAPPANYLGTGFDGNPILRGDDEDAKSAIPRRVLNAALQALGATQGTGVTDKVIGELLLREGYGNEGMDPVEITTTYLGHYYLDYINSTNGTSYESFQELETEEIKTLLNDYNALYGNAIRVEETCVEVREAFYYFYYGRAFTFNGYPVYDHMADLSMINQTVKDALNSEEGVIELFALFDGEILSNAGQETFLTFNAALKFELATEPDEPDNPPPPPPDTPDPDPEPEPPDEPEEEVEEPDVPLSNPPEEPDEEIPDEDVPLADAPQTGDDMALWLTAAALSGVGLMALLGKRKEEDAEA